MKKVEGRAKSSSLPFFFFFGCVSNFPALAMLAIILLSLAAVVVSGGHPPLIWNRRGGERRGGRPAGRANEFSPNGVERLQ